MPPQGAAPPRLGTIGLNHKQSMVGKECIAKRNNYAIFGISYLLHIFINEILFVYLF